MRKKRIKIKKVDKYEKYAEIGKMYSSKFRKVGLLIPSKFRMLCAILGVKSEDVLRDFMWIVSYSTMKDATDKQRSAARKFFLLRKFGQPQYSREQINQMFNELKSLRTIYNTIEKMDWDDRELFSKSNNMYTQYWFKRWFEINKRQDSISVLEKY